MASVAEQFQQQAARLLALAVKAREEGNIDRAESFAEMAAHCLDQATTLERLQAANRSEGYRLIGLADHQAAHGQAPPLEG